MIGNAPLINVRNIWNVPFFDSENGKMGHYKYFAYFVKKWDISNNKHVNNLKKEKEPKMKLFDFGTFQINNYANANHMTKSSFTCFLGLFSQSMTNCSLKKRHQLNHKILFPIQILFFVISSSFQAVLLYYRENDTGNIIQI